jgi:hypothetical protein
MGFKLMETSCCSSHAPVWSLALGVEIGWIDHRFVKTSVDVLIETITTRLAPSPRRWDIYDDSNLLVATIYHYAVSSFKS